MSVTVFQDLTLKLKFKSLFPILVSAFQLHPVLLCAEAMSSDVGQQARAGRLSSLTSGCSLTLLPMIPHPPPVSPASDFFGPSLILST